MNWQPIETAPRDGYVLLWNALGVQFGQYGWDEGDKESPQLVFVHDGPGIRGCTHWMPLPEPPK